MADHFRYTGSIKTKKQKRLTISPIRSFMSDRKSSRLHVKTPSMENMDDDLIVPLKRVLRKKKPKVIVSSDSDDTIIIEDDDDDDEDIENKPPPTTIKKKVKHRREFRLLMNCKSSFSFI
jgi:uncharacterized protein YlaI